MRPYRRNFVLKGTHGSGPDLAALSFGTGQSFQDAALLNSPPAFCRRRCGPEVNEWWYTQVPPRLLIEEMVLEADGRISSDYKCYVSQWHRPLCAGYRRAL